MRPSFFPELVNDPFEDPVLYIDSVYEHRALAMDLGDIHKLPPRKILRISDVFVSHTHMDHFVGFDRLVRTCLGRDKTIRMYGPPGFIGQVEQRLAGYTWNLVEQYENDFSIVAAEWPASRRPGAAKFRCRNRFQREAHDPVSVDSDVLIEETGFQVRTTLLDHNTPCLAFALEEKFHVNIWKTKLERLKLPVGPWLAELKQAIFRDDPDDTHFRVWWRDRSEVKERRYPLGFLKEELVRIVPGQKIAYVVDALYSEENAAHITDLGLDADMFFIEAFFLDEDAERAARTFHLTAAQAGLLARRARAKRMIPVHFSPRYTGDEDRIRREAAQAFSGDSEFQTSDRAED